MDLTSGSCQYVAQNLKGHTIQFQFRVINKILDLHSTFTCQLCKGEFVTLSSSCSKYPELIQMGQHLKYSSPQLIYRRLIAQEKKI